MIRTLIVDDSEIASLRLEEILEASRDIRVVRRLESASGLGTNIALGGVDVVLMDMWMPGRSGLAAIRDVATQAAVIVVSESAPDSDVAREAVAQGAFAYVYKSDLGDRKGEDDLREVVRDAALRFQGIEVPVVAIVGSTGAPAALIDLAPALSRIPATFAIVQHLPPGGEIGFARWLTGLGLRARPAKTIDVLRKGTALVGPTGWQMHLERTSTVRLTRAQPEDRHAPSADALLSSATFLGRNLIAVVLSGMGHDGARAIPKLVRAGAICFAQEPGECAARSMPESALAHRGVRRVSLATLAEEVAAAVARAPRSSHPPPASRPLEE